jgi:hypothetical protein
MIQRKQSLFLLIAAVLFIAQFAFNFWEAEYLDENDNVIATAEMTVSQITFEQDRAVVSNQTSWVMISTIAVILFAFLSIFIYGNRRIQVKFVHFTSLIALLQIVLAFYNIEDAKLAIEAAGLNDRYGLNLFFSIAAIIFLYLAARGIDSDEKLVRSADRIR